MRHSVREDWCARLPEDKSRVFDAIVHGWEEAYAVFSVPLDDAMALRADGKLTRARQCVEIASNFVTDLTAPLSCSCRAMDRWGRQFAMPPAVTSFDPSFYRSEFARQNAQWNHLMHMVLFGSRARFHHKLHVLGTNTITLGEEFRRQADELFHTLNLRPESCWPRLDELHYDLNTCLREAIVILKSFLLTLPPRNLSLFHQELDDSAAAALCSEAARQATHAHHGRLKAHFRRQ